MVRKQVIRALDLFISVLAIIVLSPVLALALVICWQETRSPIFIQDRVGKNGKRFRLYKFRTMVKGTASQPTHLVPSSAITSSGSLMRSVKIDELPQLLNVVRGDMSLVGPRPSLISQAELISARKRANILCVRPGITGEAQLSGIDMSKIQELVLADLNMIKDFTLRRYFAILFKTITFAVKQLLWLTLKK